jgi:hypothetical protein
MYTGINKIRRIVKLFGMFIDMTYSRRTRGSILVRGCYLVNAVAVMMEGPYNSPWPGHLRVGRVDEHVTADV